MGGTQTAQNDAIRDPSELEQRLGDSNQAVKSATQMQVPAVSAPSGVARTAALVSVGLGGIALTAAWLDVPIGHGWARLHAVSALLFVFLGTALLLVLRPARPQDGIALRNAVGRALSVLALGIGLLRLLEYLFGWDSPLNHYLGLGSLAEISPVVRGQVPFPTALSGFLLGAGLVLLDVRLGKVWPSQALAVMSVLVGFLALIGHLCNVPEFYGYLGGDGAEGMGVVEVAVGLFLGAGLLCARAERGLMGVLWSGTPGGMLARWLMLAPAAGLLLTGLVYLALYHGIHTRHEIRTWALGLADLVFVTVPIWAAAHALHRAGLERDHAQHVLEERVRQRTAELTRANAALQGEILEHRQAEQALRVSEDRLANQAAELERVVSERTAKLRETIGDLEAFSYSVAHDMRAPLRGMQGFARILLEDHAHRLDAEGRSHLDRIFSSAARMDLLIQDALSYTKVLRSTTHLSRVELEPLVRDLVATYPDWQPPKAQIQIDGPLPAVLGHPGFLGQCVSNLVGNAVKFVAPGATPSVRIWAESMESDVRLCFQDNGIGIAAKDHDRVFRMFERLNPADRYEGTGIGLAIVHKAVALMGGRVDFSSQPGQGTTFWIELRRPDSLSAPGDSA